MYGKLIQNNRSNGDNLLGFLIDTEHYLEDSEYFSKVKVKTTSELDSLIVATCIYEKKIPHEKVVSELSNIWINYLRYNEFEKHKIEFENSSIVLFFCTISGSLGVTGKIIATAI